MRKMRNRLITFFKYPDRGLVKTRLEKYLGTDVTFQLYQQLLYKTLRTIDDSKASITTYLDSPGKKKLRSEWFGRRIPQRYQRGLDLGSRMLNAFLDEYNGGYDRVVLIGSDCPSIQPYEIGRAFHQLKRQDAILGPAMDGGYYLIGFNFNFLRKKAKSTIEITLKRIFEKMRWSTNKVYGTTFKRLLNMGFTVQRVGGKHDLDDINSINAKILCELYR